MQVREHALGFGLAKDAHLASSYRASAQGRENAARGIPGDRHVPPGAAPSKAKGKAPASGAMAKGRGPAGRAKGVEEPAGPPGRAGWPFEDAPAPEAYHGCKVQVGVLFGGGG